MGAHVRREERSLKDRLLEETHRFDFYQAVRLLNVASSQPVRFRSSTSMAFPSTDVASLRYDGETPELTVNFLGLAGAHGPLPDAFTELLRDRLREGDPALRDFLDIFNHRLVSLMYEARRQRRAGMDVTHPHQHPFARYLEALMGILSLPTRLRHGLVPHARVLTSGASNSMAVLEQVLGDRLGTRVEGESLLGDWLPLPPELRTHIGASGRNQQLGQGTVLGTRAWDQQARFALRIGPLPWKQFVQMLPGGTSFGAALTHTRLVAPSRLTFDFVLRMEATQVPELRLRSRRKKKHGLPRKEGAPAPVRGPNQGPRLGWTSWLYPIPSSLDTVEVRISSRHTRID